MTKLNVAEKPTETLGTDLIFGAASIAGELGVSTRRAFYLCEHGYIPAKNSSHLGRLAPKIARALRHDGAMSSERKWKPRRW